MSEEKLLSHNARVIEAVLFIENEPLETSRLAMMTGIEEEEVSRALEELSEHYFKNFHGLELINSKGAWAFSPCENLRDSLRKIYGKKVDRRLSKAAMETLSIVAYGQPVTRKEIDRIRGVDSDTIVRLLRDRDYIKIIGRKDVSGHPCLYGTTKKFLFEFGLSSISDLPKMSEADKQRFEDET